MSVFYEAPVRYEKYIQAKGRNLRNRKKKDFTDEVASSTYMKKHRKQKVRSN